ncbi:zinc-finger domain-containing protein [Pelistega ratti]|uniref:zinc-finger domain-containing protein n=1 Tax=Pelistega ratti TaxID=2652177 RepID=UPI00135B6B5A|nr:zinc-finger domain-containing protein [Pelistega ratti]
MADQKKPEVIEITAQDVPLYCPPPNAPRWRLHPRVFLDIAHSPDHSATCPYCSTTYTLKAGEKLKGH